MKSMKSTLAFLFAFEMLYAIQGQQQHHRFQRTRPAFSFQSFDQSSGFPGGSAHSPSTSGISSHVAAQLGSGPGPLAQIEEQPQQTFNNDIPNTAALPLYKQSYPGLYVKGHTAASFKYEPTRQVAHHHGPDYNNVPLNIASSPQHDFGSSSFN